MARLVANAGMGLDIVFQMAILIPMKELRHDVGQVSTTPSNVQMCGAERDDCRYSFSHDKRGPRLSGS